jgi:Rrf2 family protein
VLNFTKDLEYALLCLTAMAQKKGVRVSANALSSEHGLSPSLISKILQKLNRAKLISSTAGVNGGYALQRDPETITIQDVASSLNDDLHMTDCESKDGCKRSEICLIRPTMHDIQKNIWSVLESTTLAAFVKSSKEPVAG